MVVIFVYYHPTKNSFYYKCCITYFAYDDKEKNSYGHLIVQRLVVYNGHLYDLDYYNNLKYLENQKKEIKNIKKRHRKNFPRIIFKKLVNHLIDLLYKLKSRF